MDGLDFGSFGVFSREGKRHTNEDRYVAFTHLHLCPNISIPAWQQQKKKKKKKGAAGGDSTTTTSSSKSGGSKAEKAPPSTPSTKKGGEEEGGYLPLSYFAVYDGHGGSLCVETVRARLHKYIINQRTRGLFFVRDPELINEMLIREAIRRGFEDMDREVLRITEQKNDSSGSCAVVIILLYNRMFIAHVGDTRAVLGQLKGGGAGLQGSVSEPFSPLPTRLYGELKKTNSDNSILPGHLSTGEMVSSRSADGVTTPRRRERRLSDEDRGRPDPKWARKTLKKLNTVVLTEDHKASSEKEKKRMKLKGGFVANGRVFGILAVARAFGDRSLKMSPQEYQLRKVKGGPESNRASSRPALGLSQVSDESSDEERARNRSNSSSSSTSTSTSSEASGGDAEAEAEPEPEKETEGAESGAVATSTATPRAEAETGSPRAEAGTKAMSQQTVSSSGQVAVKRNSTRVATASAQRGKDLLTSLPFDNDELWAWVESREFRIDEEAEARARKERKKREKEERARAGGGDLKASGEGKNGTYEAMTEKEMKRRQDKALKKRSKQIKKEKEQLKEKERKVKEMAKILERRGTAGEGVVVALPEIDCRIISPEDRFVLIASDGLWDVCPSKEAVKLVSQLYIEKQFRPPAVATAEEADATPSSTNPLPTDGGPVPGTPVPLLRSLCEIICRTARKSGSSDDITSLLIALHPALI